ncbi:MAG: diguanylate cyclase, partial [Rubrivivax sp.]|nr:diguanylate cyclase [Rubrivivax sp.]
QLLAQAKAADTDSQRQLALAWSGWRLAREQLWLAGSAMLDAAEADAPGPKLAQARAAVAALADPALHAAQQLVDSFAQLTRERHLSAVTAIRVWAAVNLILLALLAVGVAEPLARLVRRQYRRLADQTTELERLALVAERTSNLVMISDAAGRISWVNQAFSRISGHSEQAAQGQDPLQLLFGAGSPADALATAKLRAAMAGGASLRQQIAIKPLQGPVVWLDLDSQPLRGADGQAKGFVHVGLDVTERRQALLDARVAAIAFDSQEAMMITDAAQHIVKVNPAFTRITGYGAGEALGRRPGELLQSGRQGEAFYARMLQALSEQHHWQGEIWNRRKNGEIFPEWLSITAVCDEQGTARHYVAVFSDITQKKQAEQAIHDLAFYDPLTELPNRRLLHDRLQQTMAASARHGSEAALLFLDLDHFKVLNDSKGHDYGDLLLIEVARRLRDSVRANDTVARHGGDEFVVVLDGLGADPALAARQAAQVAEKVREAISQPYRLKEHVHHSSPSIGVCLFSGHEVDADELLRRADGAMYLAKKGGRNAVRFYDAAQPAATPTEVGRRD